MREQAGKICCLLCWLQFVLSAYGNAEVSSILIFGDSTMDPGNNNYINTPFKSNFWPYGKDFIDSTPTGRWSNGRLAVDFIANYLGIKEFVPPYLDPKLTIRDLITGVSFASAGSGFDPFTSTISKSIPLRKQLQYLKKYEAKLEAAMGRNKTKKLINNALFIVSAGTNDFLLNYFYIETQRQDYNISTYTNLVKQEARKFLEELYNEGGRRIGVVGLPPMGCLPFAITFHNHNKHSFLKRECNHTLSSIARNVNQIFKNELNGMQAQLKPSGSRIAYIDIYGPLEEMILHRKYNFEEVKRGCCGTGLLEFSLLCNRFSPVCGDANRYVFWDAFHPTERSSRLVFQRNRPTIDYLVRPCMDKRRINAVY